MAKKVFKGFKQVLGEPETPNAGYVYFIRESGDTNAERGYLSFNGKKYGNTSKLLTYESVQTLTAEEKQNVLTTLGIADELVYLALTCTTPEDIIGAVVSVTYDGNTTNYTWDGSTLEIVIPMFVEYTISFSSVPGYYKPDSVSRFSKKNAVRRMMVDYNTALFTDLSMLDITGGTVSLRETANCYVISQEGYYELPLVYGCSIMSGETNASAYTQVTGTYTSPFYNYLNEQITSPFIEEDTGVDAVSGQPVLIDTPNFVIDDIYLTNRALCKYLRFHVSSVPSLGGNATIAIKDGNGQIMWSWHIWAYPFELSTFAHTNTNNKTYNILDVNLGWVKDSSDSKKGTSPYYQWGRKDPMLRSSASAAVGSFSITSTAGSLAATIQNPNVFNAYEQTHYNWWQNGDTPVDFYNYWDASQISTGNADKRIEKTVYDPSPVGFHIPCGNTYLGFSTSNGNTWDNGWTWDGNFFQAAGYRYSGSGGINSVGSNGYCWLASSYSQNDAYNLNFDSENVYPQDNYYRANGFSVRPVARPQI